LQDHIHGVVIIVGGSSDWDTNQKANKKGTYQKWLAGEGYKDIGYKFVVLPNLHNASGSRSNSWTHEAHVLDTAICQFVHESLGALLMVGISRGAWHACDWTETHSHWFQDKELHFVGAVLSLCGYDGTCPQAAINRWAGKCEAKTRHLLANPVRKIIMWSTRDTTSGYDQCPEYYDVLKAHAEDTNTQTEHHSKIWIGNEFRMNHDWFRFLIDGWQHLAPESENNLVRREAWRFLCGRIVPDAA
jgi:hypothetical protein